MHAVGSFSIFFIFLTLFNKLQVNQANKQLYHFLLFVFSFNFFLFCLFINLYLFLFKIRNNKTMHIVGSFSIFFFIFLTFFNKLFVTQENKQLSHFLLSVFSFNFFLFLINLYFFSIFRIKHNKTMQVVNSFLIFFIFLTFFNKLFVNEANKQLSHFYQLSFS